MLNKDKLDTFFSNMKEILSSNIDDKDIREDKTLIKKVEDKEGDQRTNVIYLTTACNLRCEYCYEQSSREGLPDTINLTTDQIDDFLQEIYDREKGLSSTIVIMGGEPFLRFDLIQYVVARILQFPDKEWGISLVTNGTFFNNKIAEKFKNLLRLCNQSSKVSFSLEISYDASGHSKRKWPDGTSSLAAVEKGIFTVVSHNIPFRISYVVHSLNYKNVVEDVIRILERWSGIDAIIIGYAYLELDEALNSHFAGQKIKKQLTPYLKEVYKHYKVPICAQVCNLCKRCKKDNFVGNSYLSPTTGISYDKKSTEHGFQQF